MAHVTSFEVHDVRFPTSLTADGSDAMNVDCDYSAAYVIFHCGADSGPIDLEGHGMTFTIGRGNEIVVAAIQSIAPVLIGTDLDTIRDCIGDIWRRLSSDSQIRWIGPEKGVSHLAHCAIMNAMWDLFAKLRQQPLWKALAELTSEELMSQRNRVLWYLTDFITPKEALAIFAEQKMTAKERINIGAETGYPAYTTSVGWLGYSDDKLKALTTEALSQGFRHFKLKVGQSLEADRRRLSIVRKITDQYGKEGKSTIKPFYGTKASSDNDPLPSSVSCGPRSDCVLMVDANQVWDVDTAIDYMIAIKDARPWFIEEPTSPDDVLGHKAIRTALRRHNIGVATGEMCHNRVMWKQFLASGAIDVAQIDSCRTVLNETLAVMLMAKKADVPIMPHAGGVGLCELVSHLALIDFVLISGRCDRGVCEWVDHLHEHFHEPAQVRNGRYIAPVRAGYGGEMKRSSIEEFEYPNGIFWSRVNG